MNCKPGDLAVICRTMGYKEVIPLLGKIIKVTSIIRSAKYGPIWAFDGDEFIVKGEYRNGVADCVLRPIRYPGDDATDEMIQRLGSPNKQEQKA